MEEEVNYATVIFKAKDKPHEPEIIYDEVKAGEQASDTKPVLPVENKQKARLCTAPHLVAASLGIVCVILVSVMVLLTLHLNGVISEQSRDITNLTAQTEKLWTEKTDLQRRTEELTREKDGLNWTIRFIMEHEVFPVKAFCPQKVCKPCMEGWLLFQSKCYQFYESDYYSWKNWEDSRNECKRLNADLVVIESQEEQDFINNHTKHHSYDSYGYWIGLSNKANTWMWVNGRSLSVTYWKTEARSAASCTQILPHAAPLANWDKAWCSDTKRWICEASCFCPN